MIQTLAFGSKAKDNTIKLFELTNKNGVCAKITNYGAILTSLTLPLLHERREVVLGFDSVEDYQSSEYLKNDPFFGGIMGRFANRINKGKVSIDGKEIQLPQNHGEHLLHGGDKGFDKKIWDAEIIGESKLQLSLFSADGDQNFPGNLKLTVSYELSEDNELSICYSATCDKTSPINLTSHSYFNFTGGQENIMNHELQIEADNILESDKDLIPTGRYQKVDNTAFDFRTSKKISKDIDMVGNYDDCFVLKSDDENFKKVAELSEEISNIKMEIFTDFPGIQVYTGKYINVKGGKHFGPFSGVALETQDFPDAPNQKDFPHGFIHQGEEYKHQTCYKFHF